jgi:hypothetical protein
MIVDDVIGAVKTPGVIGYYSKWSPLSKKWTEYKGTNQHYIGLSNSLTRSSALGRKKAGGMSRKREHYTAPKGLYKVGSFQSYIQSLNRPGTTERFFGPVSIIYDLTSPGADFRAYPKQLDGIVKRTDVQSIKSGKFVSFPKTLKLSATITAFGNLKGVTFDEWHIVDYIIKRADPSNEKQWVKINSQYGFGRSHRPIRSVVTPILKYYLQRRFPEIVQEAVKARSQK